tara:strand:- start:114 stop:965 length:852 start_codon:yes stop_codon:yes gene_type:complete
MKIAITSGLLLIGAFMFILVPNSEIHSAKISKFTEKHTTFTPEKVLEDPSLIVHKIKKEFQAKLKKSDERMYSLSKQKNRLMDKVKSDFGQIDLLRASGNKEHEKWLKESAALNDMHEDEQALSREIESLNGDVSNKAKNKLKIQERKLRDLNQYISLKAFRVEELNFNLLDIANKIKNLKHSNENSKNVLEKNLAKTKLAYLYQSNLSRDLNKIKNVEIDASLAGKETGFSEGNQHLMEAMSEIAAIEGVLEKQDSAYTSAYTASQEVSNDELLALIHMQGF